MVGLLNFVNYYTNIFFRNPYILRKIRYMSSHETCNLTIVGILSDEPLVAPMTYHSMPDDKREGHNQGTNVMGSI